MAFDQHIAADQVDDFNLFSAFVRVPLLLLGGVLGGRVSSSKTGGSHLADDDDCQQSTATAATTISSVHLLQSEVCIHHVDDDSSSRRIVSDFSMDESEGAGMRRAKKMSWSDESGKRLVEYDDESIPYDPSPYSSTAASAPRPAKSAIRRSRSVRQVANENLSSQDSAAAATRYMPNMNRAGNGLVMPSRPYGGSSNHAPHGDPSAPNGASSEMSPQWGWYINTTPPTPEMYHSSSSSSSRLIRPADTRGVPGAPHFAQQDGSSTGMDGRRCQNHVFQTLQSSNAPMGWTSVPI